MKVTATKAAVLNSEKIQVRRPFPILKARSPSRLNKSKAAVGKMVAASRTKMYSHSEASLPIPAGPNAIAISKRNEIMAVNPPNNTPETSVINTNTIALVGVVQPREASHLTSATTETAKNNATSNSPSHSIEVADIFYPPKSEARLANDHCSEYCSNFR